MPISPCKPAGSPVAEKQARRSGADTGVPPHAGMQCAKVFCLTDEGEWYFRGSGHVTINYIKGSRELALAAVDENNVTLLHDNIRSDIIYLKHDERTILWKHPQKGLGFALKFQEASGFSYTWDSIHKLQLNLQFDVPHSQISPRLAFECQEASTKFPHVDSLVSVHDELKDLPPLELSSLPLMLKIILGQGTADKMRVAELISQDHKYFPKLVNLFKMCEALKDMDALHMIFRLVKGIILLNNSVLFEKMFSDALILDIIGALEYDPDVHNVQSHRTFLQEQAFKEAIPIRNASVLSKIHQTYRIGYIKKIILPEALDGATLASLDTIVLANNALVSSILMDDASFIHELITKMKSPNISAESKSKLVLFLDELCTLSEKSVQRLQLCRDLVSEGVLDIICDVLQCHDKEVASTGTNILIHFLDQDPNLVITYIAHQDQNVQEDNSLIEILIQGIITGFGEEMHFQYSDILKTLMDSSSVDMATNSMEVAIEIFYEKHFHKLIDVISSSCHPKGVIQPTSGSVGVATSVELQHPAEPEILLNICELLCFCVLHHPDRIKLNFFTNNSLEKILTLTQRREKILAVAAVRFMRTVIGRKDEFLIDHVIKFNLLKPIIEAFVENGYRCNMLHSGVLELLEYIRKENIELLIEYVSESFWEKLVKFEQLRSIQAFKPKCQQIMKFAGTNPSTSLIDMRKKAEERVIDKKKEGYFNDDSDGEHAYKWAIDELKQFTFKSADGSETCHNPARPKLVFDTLPPEPVRFSKKPKLQVGISCPKIVDEANVPDRYLDLEDIGDGSPGSQIGQNAMLNPYSVDETEDDDTGSQIGQNAMLNPYSVDETEDDDTDTASSAPKAD